MKKEDQVEAGVEEGCARAEFTREEKFISGKIGRRGFMAAGVGAAATLAALCGKEAGVARAEAPATTADTVIVLWMAGGMAQTETDRKSTRLNSSHPSISYA